MLMTITPDRRIGHNLRCWRIRSHVTQADVAATLNVDRSVICRIENGERPLRLAEAVLLCTHHDCSLDLLCDCTPLVC